MIQIKSFFSRFRREEEGNATIEFAILFPFFIFMFCAAVELGMITFRHSMLERGLDMAVRDVRLTTGANFQHDDILERTCGYAGFLPDCDSNLRLEMIPLDMHNYVSPDNTANCIDHSLTANPIRQWTNGQQNQMMVLRACYVFKPVFPLTGLGRHLTTDQAGNAAMVATSAFVQEPI
ncbi:pilus assembly protein [Lentibacter algarum]|uniref:TadE/TadG family type IV pilus assembly protein n=1 Tax=Lentibacter algarum TaxID=576131 RepID=UPI001C0883C2|nr:TadE/TadG family type IV pilus assembly protein [Lentibacter algarum]MBU2982906.1 pilus assembly protein [Lentibacter algarum]